MSTSVFDLFSVGIGPSSSHTVGPMRAAAMFVKEVAELIDLQLVTRVEVDLYGSLAATGRGHGTLGAVLLGLEGNRPETIDPGYARDRVEAIDCHRILRLGGIKSLPFSTSEIGMHPLTIKGRHTNTMRFVVHAQPAVQPARFEATYYSVGGGFVERDGGPAQVGPDRQAPLHYETADELLSICVEHDIAISEVMWRNELVSSSRTDVRDRLLGIWRVMEGSIHNGFAATGYLPGPLKVSRRAPGLRTRLNTGDRDSHAHSMDWLNAAAMAVNEENAAGGRIVTAPTNGAAGIVPAVLYWALRYLPELGDRSSRGDAIVRYLLTAGAIAVLYKQRASISGAEVGCQGEVGSACSMAAAGLAELMGATPTQVENAAEIGIEHNLGLTCDPIGGLVQIPCIERNAIAAVKAVNAAKIALHGDGTHRVTLDQAIETMRQTGQDMLSKYKETSTGGLAVNVPEC
ncbi:L-serine ammonia-lyase [Mycobacterium sp. NPDC003449]